MHPWNVAHFAWNDKRVYRIYRVLELNLRIKPRRRLVRDTPQPLAMRTAFNKSRARPPTEPPESSLTSAEATANVRFEKSPQTLGPALFSRAARNRWQSSSMSRAEHALVNARRTTLPDPFWRARRNLIRNCARALRPMSRRVVAASSPRHIAMRRTRTRRSQRRHQYLCSSSLSSAS